jgi:hypothetical protein
MGYQYARRTRRLTHEEIPTVLGTSHILCVRPGRSGPVFWPAFVETASAEDWSYAVDWETGVEMLRDNGLTIGLDGQGFAHIRYVDQEARDQAREARNFLKRRTAEGGPA